MAVTTITWARSQAEADLLEQSIDALLALDIPVVVADRGTHSEFLRWLRGRRGLEVTVATESGLVPQMKATLSLAARLGTRFVLYTEPDKRQFFETGLEDFIRQAPGEDTIGAVIASRSAAGFDTFPAMQRYTESVINELCREVIGHAGDYCYGPFLMHRALIPRVAELPDHLGWGWRPATFLAARRSGRQVIHLWSDYVCPPNQRIEDAAERLHRIRQLSQNVLGLLD
jgi:hypothetical protein